MPTAGLEQSGQVHGVQHVFRCSDGWIAVHKVSGHGQGVFHFLQPFQHVSVCLEVRNAFQHGECGAGGNVEEFAYVRFEADLNDSLW